MSTHSGPARARATIRDVAALAGVGIKTVSRVINNEANVSAPMRERVQHAVVALNFQPNQGAGALRRANQRTGTLGLLLDAVDNPFSASVNRAVEVVATARGTAVFAASFQDDPAVERSLIDAFTRRRVDGLILTTISPDHDYLRAEQEQGTPIVFIDRPPAGLVADAVLTDNYDASAAATLHLLNHGHRRIAHLADELAITTSRERRRAFADGMAQGSGAGGRTGDRYPIHVDDLSSQGSAEAAVRELMALAEPPTAIFASQNLITVGALRALHALGLQHEVALVGFDDLLLADMVDPAVTVVAQDPLRMGELAAERVFARLDGDTSPAATVVIPSQLVVRGSGEIRPPGA